MPTNNTPQQTVRLDAAHRVKLDELRNALRSPLLPAITAADAIRAAIRDTHSRLVGSTAATMTTVEPQ